MQSSIKDQFIIAIVAGIFFIPFLGGVHLFDWDEINFAEMAREMVVSGDYLRPQVNYVFFTEKPVLFMWMQALAMHLFGVGEYAARFPNALAGIFSLVILYRLGLSYKNRMFGWLWAGAYFGSILPNLYFKSGIIDPWFNLFIFLGITSLYAHHKAGFKHFSKHLIFAGIYTGLGVLTKGPVAFLITALLIGVMWLMNRFKFFISIPALITYTAAMLVTSSIWYGVITLMHGIDFAIEFTVRQYEIFKRPDAGHAGFVGYHFVVILLACFPSSILFLPSMKKLRFTPDTLSFTFWMKCLFWVVLILFTIVKSKIVHYSSLTYFPLTFLAATVVYQLIKKEIEWPRWLTHLLLFIGSIWATITLLLPIAGMNIEKLNPLFQKDPFAFANLNADVHWSGFEALPGFIMLAILIFAIRAIKAGLWKRAAIVLFVGTAVFVQSVLYLDINNIEAYSQGAAVEFWESKAGEDCYLETERYRSYGHLFYGRVMPYDNPKAAHEIWLENGKIDKPVYFGCKLNKIEYLEQKEDIYFLYEKNGFTFWERLPKEKHTKALNSSE